MNEKMEVQTDKVHWPWSHKYKVVDLGPGPQRCPSRIQAQIYALDIISTLSIFNLFNVISFNFIDCRLWLYNLDWVYPHLHSWQETTVSHTVVIHCIGASISKYNMGWNSKKLSQQQSSSSFQWELKYTETGTLRLTWVDTLVILKRTSPGNF